MFKSEGSKKAVCLVCGFCSTDCRKFNLERHYTTNHADLNVNYPRGSSIRRDYIKRLDSAHCTQQSMFVTRHEQNKSMLAASYEMALLLAKKMKPYTDGEDILKPALEIAARMLGDKQVESKFKDIPLSNNTVTRRVEELAGNVTEQIKYRSSICSFFSLAMDESTDLSDTAQVTIFIRAVGEDFEVIEEVLGVEAMHGTTKGVDLFNTLKTCVERCDLDWRKLDSVCTDGAPAMTGTHIGCLSLLEQFIGRSVLKYHCFIHQESLCGKSLDMKHVMDIVLKCVYKIQARALNRREFRQFLEDINQEYGNS